MVGQKKLFFDEVVAAMNAKYYIQKWEHGKYYIYKKGGTPVTEAMSKKQAENYMKLLKEVE